MSGYLKVHKRNPTEIWRLFITINEEWGHIFTPEDKENNREIKVILKMKISEYQGAKILNYIYLAQACEMVKIHSVSNNECVFSNCYFFKLFLNSTFILLNVKTANRKE